MRWRAAALLPVMAGMAPVMGGCAGVQSALSPDSPEADRIALLSWILIVGGFVILIAVIGIAAFAIYGRPEARGRWLGTEAVVIGGGLIFPVVILSALLVYGVAAMRAESRAVGPDDGSFKVAVIGERWWWRVLYPDGRGRTVESANEIRVPVGRRVAVELSSADVIHSFWVPKLAGKLDMIPGRKTVLRFSSRRPGVSRGQCAEYCGGAHALMAFNVVAMAKPEFEKWWARETAPATPPQTRQDRFGQMLFLSSGCGGCHAVRGTEAAGNIGPDLTHIGGRMSLAAATMPNNAETIARWIVRNQHIKPGNLMPPFGIFSEAELAALSGYLANLR